MRRLLLLLSPLLGMGGPAAAQNRGTSNISAPTNVKVIPPLQLSALRNLRFGTIVLGTVTSTQTVTVATTGRSCGSRTQLNCSGAFATALYRVIGTNNQVVLISASTPTFALTNQKGDRLTMFPIMPRSVTMPNSGNQGVEFDVGGSLSMTADTPEGLYSDKIEIQVSY